MSDSRIQFTRFCTYNYDTIPCYKTSRGVCNQGLLHKVIDVTYNLWDLSPTYVFLLHAADHESV